MRYRLSVCAIMKNEHKDVLEWVAYHNLVGVEHFYIYDNNDVNGMDDILKKYVDSGIVDLIHLRGEAQQLPAYNDCLARFSNESKYIAFIDADEFIVPIDDVDLANLVDKLIEEYRSYDDRVAGLVAKWAVYGSGNHVVHPSGLVIENYLYKENGDHDKHVKSIVDPRKANKFLNPHFCSFCDNCFAVDEEGRRSDGPFLYYEKRNKIRINHYYYKSEDDFKSRIQRKRSDILQTEQQMIDRITAELPALRNSNREYDPIMLRYVSRVKEEMSKYLQ